MGGIANITAIPAGGTSGSVVAFDTGPGNMVIDALVQIQSDGRIKFDKSGRLAARGHVNEKLLSTLLRASYFRQSPPKTAGREQYGREFVSELLATRTPIMDLVATATVFTASSIAFGIGKYVSFMPDELIISGGGAHNRTLLAYLQAFLPTVRLRSSNEFGIDGDAKEAIAFAILAYETWNRRPSNLPSATGAGRPVVLGKVSF
ncbi:MAG: anhydro-N-acetylmuramic acid kinase [Bryobacteraceae bacterium]